MVASFSAQNQIVEKEDKETQKQKGNQQETQIKIPELLG